MSFTLDAGRMRFNPGGACIMTAYKDFVVTPGKPYNVDFDLDRTGIVNFTAEIYTTATLGGTGTLITTLTATNGRLSYTLTPAAGQNFIRVSFKKNSGENTSFYIDNLQIRTVASPYAAVVVMKSDYYPYGMQMPGRHTNDPNYRYGYNGMELDNEAKGNGNSYTTEFRQYDPRLGRWLSLDPLASERPSYNPYNYCRNNPIIMTDKSGLQDDWYKDDEGNVEWKNNTESAVYDDKDKLWRNIGKQLNDADIKRVGVGMDFALIKSLAAGYQKYMTPWAFEGAGKNILTIVPPDVAQYYHPLMNEEGFVKDRITSNSALFEANESINNNNFAAAMVGALVGGEGPENFYFGPGSSVWNSMVNSEIVQKAIVDFQAENKGGNSDEITALGWRHYGQSPLNAIISILGSWNQGGSRNAATPANLIGGAAIKIVPLGAISSNEIVVRITIVNVTSVGSGSLTQGGGKGDQSFPRPLGVSYAQPYTNISQTIEIDTIIALPK